MTTPSQLDLLPVTPGVSSPADDFMADDLLTPTGKRPGAFKTISETAKLLGVPQHVLRFWESRFRHIKPLKMKGGRRYYRPEDIELLVRIKTLLYQQGYTIKGARKALNDARRNRLEYLAQTMPAALPDDDYHDSSLELMTQPESLPLPKRERPAPAKPDAAELEALKRELTDLRSMLRKVLEE